MRINLWGVVLLVVATLIGGGAHGQDLNGSGEWQSRSGETIKGKWKAELTRSNNDLSGTITLTGTPLFAGGTVTGTIDGDVVMFGVMAGESDEVRFTGKLADGVVTGDWECDAVSDGGTWKGNFAAAES